MSERTKDGPLNRFLCHASFYGDKMATVNVNR
jgi:hypothetical protein